MLCFLAYSCSFHKIRYSYLNLARLFINIRCRAPSTELYNAFDRWRLLSTYQEATIWREFTVSYGIGDWRGDGGEGEKEKLIW